MPLCRREVVETEERETDFFEEVWAGSEAGNSRPVKVYDVHKYFSGEGQTCGRQQNILKAAGKKKNDRFRFVESP